MAYGHFPYRPQSLTFCFKILQRGPADQHLLHMHRKLLIFNTAKMQEWVFIMYVVTALYTHHIEAEAKTLNDNDDLYPLWFIYQI